MQQRLFALEMDVVRYYWDNVIIEFCSWLHKWNLFIISSQNIVTNNKTLTFNINKGAEVCCSTEYLLLPNGTQLAMYSGIVGYAIVIFAIWLQLPCISNTRTLLFTCTTHGNKNKPFCYRCTRFFVILKTSFMQMYFVLLLGFQDTTI